MPIGYLICMDSASCSVHGKFRFFCFGELSGILLSKIFHLWLVDSVDMEPVDTESRLHLPPERTDVKMTEGTYIKAWQGAWHTVGTINEGAPPPPMPAHLANESQSGRYVARNLFPIWYQW